MKTNLELINCYPTRKMLMADEDKILKTKKILDLNSLDRTNKVTESFILALNRLSKKQHTKLRTLLKG